MASVQIGEGGATAAHRALLPLAPEDESEWEYEYSTTETEVFPFIKYGIWFFKEAY